MVKPKKPKLSPLGQAVQDILFDMRDQYFEIRNNFNNECAFYLNSSAEFQNQIKTIRKQFKIPHLDPQHDVKDIPLENYVDAESYRLNSKSISAKKTFDRHIDALLDTFQLPTNFRDWIIYYVLYGKPPWIPTYSMELVNSFIQSHKNPEKFRLSIPEKKYILDVVNSKIGKLPTKKRLWFMRKLKAALAKSKNTRRRFRNFKESVILASKKGKKEAIYNPETGEKMMLKRTYRSIATANKDICDVEADKIAANSRKKAQRFQNRQKDIFKK